jgi:hypothetical protein
MVWGEGGAYVESSFQSAVGGGEEGLFEALDIF